MPARRLIQFIILASTWTMMSSAQTTKFTVLVLDALNGKAQKGVHVLYFCEREGFRQGSEAVTGPEGFAEVPYLCKNDARIQFDLDVPGESKDECGGVFPLRIVDILTHGFISEPNAAGGDWCPTKQRRKLKPVPGQVTVFVKKPTWWQSHVAG